MVTFFILMTAPAAPPLGTALADLPRDLGVMLLTLVAYGALFGLLGVLLKRPVIPGLVFLYGWELLANVPGYLPRFTLTAWLRSLVPYRPAEDGLAGLFQQVLPADQALVVLIFVSVAARGRSGLDLFEPRVRSRSVGGRDGSRPFLRAEPQRIH